MKSNNNSIGPEDQEEGMVPCPYEPKFFVAASKLEAHLKKCPKIVLQ